MTVQTTKIYAPEETHPEVLAQRRELSIGSILWDRYEVVALLGSSTLGEVWLCRDREENKDVSLRWLPPAMRRSKQVMASIHQAIRRMTDALHPSLAAVQQLVYVGDQIYVIGAYAPGEDIGTWMASGPDGPRTLEDLIPILQQVAEGLDVAHSHGIIHRNIKPSNIRVDDDGVGRVTDFGLTPHRHVTVTAGAAKREGVSGAYLAPELHGGEEPDSASDQYAFAALTWELLAGAPPEPGAAPPAEWPPAIRAALRRAMAPQPRARFVNCADFVRALNGERVTARRPRSRAEWQRIYRRIMAVAGIVVSALAVWMLVKLVIYIQNHPFKPAPVAEKPEPRKVQRAKPKPVEQPVFVPPPALVATTPLPVEGQPWVAHTVKMEFMWIPPLQLWVGRFEVTNEEYQKKEPEHDSGAFREHPLNDPRQPVVRVNFDDCVAYAAWLTEQERAAGKLPEHLAYRLPSRQEAIQYTSAGQNASYPWGEVWPPRRGNYADSAFAQAFSDLPCISDYHDGFAVTAPVEQSGENAWGIFGAGGNVWETTAREPGSDKFGGWQGGGWDDHQNNRLRTDTCYGYLGNARGAVNGFRLVLAPVVQAPEADAP